MEKIGNIEIRIIGESGNKDLTLDTYDIRHIAFDSDYLNKLIAGAKQNWRGIDADDWLLDLRGGYEA